MSVFDDSWATRNFSERDNVFCDHFKEIEQSIDVLQEDLEATKDEMVDIRKGIEEMNQCINDLKRLMMIWYENSCTDSREIRVYDNTPKHYIKSLDDCIIKGKNCFQRFSLYDFDEKGYKIYSGEKTRNDIITFITNNLHDDSVLVFDCSLFFENPCLVKPIVSALGLIVSSSDNDNLRYDNQITESDLLDSTSEDMLEDAIKLVINDQKASTTHLQSKLKIGYATAAVMVDRMEELGIIGPFNGSRPREIFVSSLSMWEEIKPKPKPKQIVASVCFVGNYSLLPAVIRNKLDGVYIKTKE